MRIPSTLPVPLNKDVWQVVDSTKLQSYAACPRQYFFEYVLGWRLDRASNHLVFGQAWHSALEYLYKNGLTLGNIPSAFDAFLEIYRAEWPESTDDWFGGKTPEAALQGLVEYTERWASDVYDYKVLATEVYDRLPLTQDQNIVVKLDAVLQDNRTGLATILEHKTASSGGQFWARQWHLSIQIGAYISACNFFYNQEETPCIIDGTIFLRTKRDFQRERVQRSTESLRNWYNTVSHLINGIEDNFALLAEEGEHSGAQVSFPQNPVSCGSYGGCQFYDLCLGGINPIRLAQEGQPPIGYKQYWWNPLEGETKNGVA